MDGTHNCESSGSVSAIPDWETLAIGNGQVWQVKIISIQNLKMYQILGYPWSSLLLVYHASPTCLKPKCTGVSFLQRFLSVFG